MTIKGKIKGKHHLIQCVLINRDKYRPLVTNVEAPPRDNIILLILTATNGAHCAGLPFDLGGTTPRRGGIF